MPPPTDEELFERFRRRGDVDGLGQLFDRTAPALLRVGLHVSADPAAAEDLVQSTFLTAIQSAGDFVSDHRPGEAEGRPRVLSWLIGILRHQALQQRRRESRVLDAERLQRVDAQDHDPGGKARENELTEAVDSAIGTLPEQYQSVLRLRLRYGHHTAEIAHALGRPPGTVRSQLVRGLQLLRGKLPAGFATAFGVALLPGRGLAAVRAAVLRQALSHGSRVAASGFAIAGPVTGVMIMKKTLIAIAAAVLASGAWVAWPDDNVASQVRANPPAKGSDAVTVPVRDARSVGTSPAPAQGEHASHQRGHRPKQRSMSNPPAAKPMDVDDFITQPLEAILRAAGCQYPDAVLNNRVQAEQVREAVQAVLDAFKKYAVGRGRGYTLEAIRISKIKSPPADHFGEKPSTAHGRSQRVTLSTAGNMWVYEDDIPEVFALEDKILGLPEDLLTRIRKILNGR